MNIILERFNIFIIILLLLSISFIPTPLLEQYHLFIKIFLVVTFLILLVRKTTSIFKLSDFFLWFFLIAIGINVLFAQKRNISLETYIDLVVPMFFIYYLVSHSLSYKKTNFNILAKTISMSSILVSLLAVFECLFAFNPIYEFFINNHYYQRYVIFFVRPTSTQYNPVILGGYLLASLPFNFFLFRREKSFFKFLGALGMVLNTVIIILVFSRGVFLAFIIMILFYLFMQRKYSKAMMAFIFVVVTIILFSYLPYPFSRFGAGMIKSERGIISDYRFNRCIMTKEIIEDFPLTGIGFQHFRSRFYEYYPDKDKVSYEFMIADNMYLTLLAETGLIAFLAFFIFIFYIFKKAWKLLKKLDCLSDERFKLLVLLSAFIALLVNMGAYELFYWPGIYMYFCIIIGILESFHRRDIA